MSNLSALGGMAAVRVISGIMEILAALIILRLGKVESALRINAFLGLIGTLVYVIVGVLGIFAVAVKLSPLKVIVLTLGTLLVLAGTKL